MPDVGLDRLILRCYGYRSRKGAYVGVCLELNLAVEAESQEAVRKKMAEAISSYMETVFDTDDKASVPFLLSRKAPLRDWFLYYFIHLLFHIKRFPNNFVFKEYIPFQLGHTY